MKKKYIESSNPQSWEFIREMWKHVYVKIYAHMFIAALSVIYWKKPSNVLQLVNG